MYRVQLVSYWISSDQQPPVFCELGSPLYSATPVIKSLQASFGGLGFNGFLMYFIQATPIKQSETLCASFGCPVFNRLSPVNSRLFDEILVSSTGVKTMPPTSHFSVQNFSLLHRISRWLLPIKFRSVTRSTQSTDRLLGSAPPFFLAFLLAIDRAYVCRNASVIQNTSIHESVTKNTLDKTLQYTSTEQGLRWGSPHHWAFKKSSIMLSWYCCYFHSRFFVLQVLYWHVCCI
jgi:hypothetical protein